MRTLFRLTFAVLTIFISSFAAAGSSPPPPTPATTVVEDSENEAFIGFNWTFGAGLTPEVVLGYRNVDVDSTGDIEGAGANISFNIAKMNFDRIKLFAIHGDEDLQGELGFGYSLLNQEWLGTLGAQGGYINLSTDILQSGEFKFNGGLNSINDYDAPAYE